MEIKSFRDSFDSLNILVVAIASLIALPSIVVFGFIFVKSEMWQHLLEHLLSDYVTNSLILSFGVSILTLLFGISSAWFTTMYEFKYRKVLEILLIFPLAIPPFIIGYTYATIFDYSGVVQSLTRDIFGFTNKNDYYFPDIMSLGGAIFVISSVLYPYVYLIVKASFINNSTRLIEVGHSFGLSLTQSFFKIALPLARVGIVAGVSLVIMESLNEYGTVKYYGVDTFSTGIFRVWFGMGDPALAGKLSSILMFFILMILAVERLQRGKTKFNAKIEYRELKRVKPSSRFSHFIIFMIAFLPPFLGFIFPFSFLLIWSFENLNVMFESEFYELIFNSFSIAFISSLIGVLIALILAFNRYRKDSKLSKFITKIANMGYAVPGAVIAVGIMIPFGFIDNSIDDFFRRNFDISTGLILSGTFFAIVFGYIVRFLPVAFNSIDSGFSKLSKGLYEASISFGYGKFKSIYKIYIPILKANILTAMILIFIDILKELPATLILRPFNFDTLATKAFDLASNELVRESAIYSLTIIIIGMLPIYLLTKNMIKR